MWALDGERVIRREKEDPSQASEPFGLREHSPLLENQLEHWTQC